MSLVVPIVAFGIWHRKMALRYSLPSILPQAKEIGARVIVYTDYTAQFDGCGAEVKVIKRARPQMKHKATTACYRDALQHGQPIATVAADMVCSAGMLAALMRLAADYEVALCPVLRCDERAFRVALGETRLPIGPRALFDLAADTIHERQKRLFWDSMRPDVMPTMIMRRARGAIVARCFHSHPIMINASAKIGETESIDGQFIGTVPTERIHVVIDSDELMAVDVTDRKYKWDGDRIWKDPASWVPLRTNAVHRWTFEKECVMHGGEFDLDPVPHGYTELCSRLTNAGAA